LRRQCKQRNSKKRSLDVRTRMIIKRSRCLTHEFTCPWYAKTHRRHTFATGFLKKQSFCTMGPSYIKPGRTLRNKKHHVPKYKYVRAGIEDINFNYLKSASRDWNSARIEWIGLLRGAKKLHPTYLNNILHPHWWKI